MSDGVIVSSRVALLVADRDGGLHPSLCPGRLDDIARLDPIDEVRFGRRDDEVFR